MYKLFISMLNNSKASRIYVVIYIAIVAIWLSIIYQDPLNYTIIGFINFNLLFTSIIVTDRLLQIEERSKVQSYISVLQSENETYIMRSYLIFRFTINIGIFWFVLLNIVYHGKLLVILQLVYLLLLLFFNYFYIYFIQYVFYNTSNKFIIYFAVLAVFIISFLAIFTRNIMVYSAVVAILGIFFAMTIIIRRQLNELKRNKE